MIKYLYGKSKYLMPFINGEVGLRFSDLSHYSRLENAAMRDDELRKKFLIDPKVAKIKINDIAIDSNAIVGDVEINLPVMNSYCLCLSNRKDCAELYEKFNADICLAINIELLVKSLSILSKRFDGVRIEHGNVTYFDAYEKIPTTDYESLAYYKPNIFNHESEYRVLIRLPKDRNGFKTQEGKKVPFFIPGESMHLEFAFDDPTQNNCSLVETYYPASANGA